MTHKIKTILLVEDDRGTAHLVKTQLEGQGFIVSTAGNGLEALGVLENRKVDLIITDVVMPVMDGVELYSRIKKNPELTAIPVIITTNKDIFIESFKALGVNYFVDKASDIKTLYAMIRDISSKPHQEPTEFNKVLLCGADFAVMQEMEGILKERRCLVSTTNNAVGVLTHAFSMTPNAIIIDLLFRDRVTTKELIRAIKCFDIFRDTQILLYVSFAASELGSNMAMWQSLEPEVEACIDSGATCFVGRFNRADFIVKLNELKIRSHHSV